MCGQSNEKSISTVHKDCDLCQEGKGRPNSFSLAVEREGRERARQEGGGGDKPYTDRKTKREQQNVRKERENPNPVSQFSIELNVMKDQNLSYHRPDGSNFTAMSEEGALQNGK